MVTDGYQTYCGDQFIMYINVESLQCTPETNIILYINYTSKKEKSDIIFKIITLEIRNYETKPVK